MIEMLLLFYSADFQNLDFSSSLKLGIATDEYDA